MSNEREARVGPDLVRRARGREGRFRVRIDVENLGQLGAEAVQRVGVAEERRLVLLGQDLVRRPPLAREEELLLGSVVRALAALLVLPRPAKVVAPKRPACG